MASQFSSDSDERGSSALVAFAYLNALFQVENRSYSDLLASVLLRLVAEEPAGATAARLSELTKRLIGMAVPESTVIWCLARRSVRAQVVLDDGIYTFRGKRTTTLKADRAQVERESNNLVDSLIGFAHERIDEEWERPRAFAAIRSLVERHTVDLIEQADFAIDSGEIAVGAKRDRVVAAEWGKRVLTSDPARAAYLENFMKGTVIAAALVDSRRAQYSAKFKRTTIYVDTPEVLGALGYHDDAERAALRRGFQIAASAGAQIAVLESTVSEVRNVVLQAAYPPDPRRGGASRVRSHFAALGSSPATIRLAADELESDLERLGFAIHRAHQLSGKPVIDEVELRERLLNRVHSRHGRRDVAFDRSSAVDFDARALIAVHVAREGGRGDRFESCGAILLTSNSKLVSVANSVPGIRLGGFDVAIGLHRFLSLMWLRNPADFDEMPAGRLALECAALLSPSPEAWSEFQRNLLAGHEKGSISDDQLALSMYSNEFRGEVALAEAGGEEINYEFVAAAVRRRNEEIEAIRTEEVGKRESVERQLETARSHLDARGEEAERLKTEATERRDRARSRIDTATMSLVAVVYVLAAAGLSIVLGIWFYSSAPGLDEWVRISGTAVLVVLSLLPFVATFNLVRRKLAGSLVAAFEAIGS